MLGKLTKRTVDAVKAAECDVFVWDRELKGFGLKVTPRGRRVFLFQYWAPRLHRVRRRMTLGTYGALTVDQAREAAKRLQGRVSSGEDPAGEASLAKESAKSATVAAIGAEYLADCAGKIKPRTATEYERLFKVNIVPALGRKPIAHVTLRDVAALHSAHRETPYLANRVLDLVSSCLRWAESRGYRPRASNPCRDVGKFPEQSRERFLSVDEVGRLGAALTRAETKGVRPAPMNRLRPVSAKTAKHRPKNADTPIPANPFAIAAIRFLLLTGWREQEALTLRWTDVDLSRGAATLPNTKSGRSHRAIGAPALALLAALPRLKGSAYVFPGAKSGKPLRGTRRVWTAVRHEAALDDARLHDLRHTVASFAVGSGHSLYLTGKLLGHARAETTAKYAHLADDARRTIADTVSSEIASAMNGKNDGRVLPFERKA